ncbi:MAG: hypothetical protein M3N26_07605 [Pseudomonadota bacterium]|nr:hypothetical protein [Pseudomonadota bacterium]
MFKQRLMPVRRGTLALAIPLLLSAAPPQAALALDCYVTQSDSLGLGPFVRHLDVIPERRVVTIADGLHGATPRFVGNGRLITLDADRLVFDFASTRSAGRTEIDRRSGAFRYLDGRVVLSGTCQASSL